MYSIQARIAAYAVLYLLSSGISYFTTKAAIKEELVPYNWAEQGVEVSAHSIKRCGEFCGRHSETLLTISPLACTCTGGKWVRFQ